MARCAQTLSALLGRILVVVVLGAGIGLALGSLLGNVVLGIASGALIGTLAGAVLELTRRRKSRR